VAQRAAISGWLYPSRYRHTLGLTAPVPARLSVLDTADAAGSILHVINPDQQVGELHLAPALATHDAVAIHLDGQGRITPASLRPDPAGWRIPLDPRHFSTCLIASRAKGERALLSSISRELTPAGVSARLYLANLGRETVEVGIEGRASEGSTPFVRQQSVAPGSVAALEIPLGNNAFGDPQAEVILRWNGHERRLAQTLLPLSDWTPDRPPVEMGPSDEAVRFHHTHLHLTPGRYEISFDYRATPGTAKLCQATVWIERAGSQIAREVISFSKEDGWRKARKTFTVPEDAFSTSLYLYNAGSTRTLTVRDVTLTPLPPETSP